MMRITRAWTCVPVEVIVGYGQGALAIIDPSTRSKIADVRRDGTVKIVTMGRRIVGKWKVKAGQLCIEAPKPEDSQCREVWRSNDKFQLRAPGDPVPYDVTIQKQQQRGW